MWGSRVQVLLSLCEGVYVEILPGDSKTTSPFQHNLGMSEPHTQPTVASQGRRIEDLLPIDHAPSSLFNLTTNSDQPSQHQPQSRSLPPPLSPRVLDVLSDIKEDHADINWQATLEEFIRPDRSVSSTEIETSSDLDSSGDSSEDINHFDEKQVDLDDLDLQGLVEAIDTQARKAQSWQQSTLQLVDQCRVLVNAYNLWEETCSIHPSSRSSLSAQVTFQVSSRLSEKTLRSDLKIVLNFLEFFDTSPWLIGEGVDPISVAFENVLRFLCYPRPFIRRTGEALSAAQTSLEKAIRYDQIELNHLKSLSYGRHHDRYLGTVPLTSLIRGPLHTLPVEQHHQADIRGGDVLYQHPVGSVSEPSSPGGSQTLVDVPPVATPSSVVSPDFSGDKKGAAQPPKKMTEPLSISRISRQIARRRALVPGNTTFSGPSVQFSGVLRTIPPNLSNARHHFNSPDINDPGIELWDADTSDVDISHDLDYRQPSSNQKYSPYNPLPRSGLQSLSPENNPSPSTRQRFRSQPFRNDVSSTPLTGAPPGTYDVHDRHQQQGPGETTKPIDSPWFSER